MAAMNDDRHSKQVHEPDGRTGRRHAAHSEASTAPTGLVVKSLSCTVTEAQALSSADLLVLLGEDCSWQAATEHWRQRRPSLWHRTDRRAWRAEGRVLRDKLRRLREYGSGLGLPPVARTGRRWWHRRDHH